MNDLAEVIDFGQKLEVIKGDGKKLPPNNNSSTRWVDPIRTKEEIEKVKEHLAMRVWCAQNSTQKKVAARNELLFAIGIDTGLRVSDLECMTWGLIFTKTGEFYSNGNAQNHHEKKTGKFKKIYLTDRIKDSVTKYIKIVEPSTERDEYIFVSNKKRFELYNVGSDSIIIDDVTINLNTKFYVDNDNVRGHKDKVKAKLQHRGLTKEQLDEKKAYLDKMHVPYMVRRFHITEAGVDSMMKSIVKACELKGNYACRSLRKTYAYKMYNHALNCGMDELAALEKVRQFLSHRNPDDTKRYLGIKQEEDFDFMNSCDY